MAYLNIYTKAILRVGHIFFNTNLKITNDYKNAASTINRLLLYGDHWNRCNCFTSRNYQVSKEVVHKLDFEDVVAVMQI